jgi:D-alanyl-lipoteichoic acid acyltransferase DltB (MBOAT superfamily)
MLQLIIKSDDFLVGREQGLFGRTLLATCRMLHILSYYPSTPRRNPHPQPSPSTPHSVLPLGPSHRTFRVIALLMNLPIRLPRKSLSASRDATREADILVLVSEVLIKVANGTKEA